MERIFTKRHTIRTIMIQNQANNLILLALAGATLLCFVFECQAGGGQDEEIEQAKEEWLADWGKQLGKTPPEQTVEVLRQLQAAMPEDKSSEEWQKKRTELDNLIDMANLDEQCLTHDVLERFNKRYELPGYILPVSPLVQNYAKYFQNKQIEICVAKISEQVAVAVASLFEYDKQDMEALMSYSPKLKASDNLEWDNFFIGVFTDEDEKQFYKNIYRFLMRKGEFLPETGVTRQLFNRVYAKKMSFCDRIYSAMRIPADNYFKIRRHAELNEFATLFNPETLKWIKAEKLCSQIKFGDYNARKAAYNEYIKDHKSTASKILDCIRRKQTSEPIELTPLFASMRPPIH